MLGWSLNRAVGEKSNFELYICYTPPSLIGWNIFIPAQMSLIKCLDGTTRESGILTL